MPNLDNIYFIHAYLYFLDNLMNSVVRLSEYHNAIYFSNSIFSSDNNLLIYYPNNKLCKIYGNFDKKNATYRIDYRLDVDDEKLMALLINDFINKPIIKNTKFNIITKENKSIILYSNINLHTFTHSFDNSILSTQHFNTIKNTMAESQNILFENKIKESNFNQDLDSFMQQYYLQIFIEKNIFNFSNQT